MNLETGSAPHGSRARWSSTRALTRAEDALECIAFLRNQSAIQSIAVLIVLCIAYSRVVFCEP
jgi:hypothetical protein